jgi:membrane protease YdiL (CAAX protease family)
MAQNSLFRVRYFREYPWPLQLLLFLLMVMTMASLMTVVANVLVPKIFGYTLLDLSGVRKESPRALLDGALLFQALTSAGLFLLPALLYAYLSHPYPRWYLGLRAPGKAIQVPLVIVVILSATPVFLGLDALFRNILPAGSAATQATSDRLTAAFLETKTVSQMLVSLGVVALLPALGEELFFRGVIFRFVAKKTHGLLLPLIASAGFFAAVHYNPAGLPVIFAAGVLLAVIYYLTSSLWLSILAHFVYNGMQVLAVYLAQDNVALKSVTASEEVPLAWIAGGAVVFCTAFWALWKVRTPLPVGWASDKVDPDFSKVIK